MFTTCPDAAVVSPFCFLLRTTKGLGVNTWKTPSIGTRQKASNDEETRPKQTRELFRRAAHATLEKEIEFNNG